MPIDVVLVEDHHLVREGLRLVLGGSGTVEVVGEAGSVEEAFAVLASSAPDVVLLDLGLGDAIGFDLLRAVRARYPSMRILVLTMYRDPETVRQALQAGADGYLVKGAHARELVDAIHAVVRGERYLHSSVAGGVIDDSQRRLSDGSALSLREREILAMIARGQTAPQIGLQLGISTHTVHRHVANISAKLGVRGIAPLVRYAVEHGIGVETAAR